MAWTNTPYCQLSDVRLALGFTPNDSSTDNADDIWLQTLIPVAQSAIDEELGYTFQQNVGAQFLYDGHDDTQLLIDDCIAVTQVLETTYNVFIGSNGVFTTGNTQTIDITADCVLVPVTAQAGYGIILKRKTGLPFIEGLQNYAVTGTFGQPSVPKDISYACTRLVVHLYKLRATDYGATPADKEFSTGVHYSTTWPADVRKIVCDHKQRGFYGR